MKEPNHPIALTINEQVEKYHLLRRLRELSSTLENNYIIENIEYSFHHTIEPMAWDIIHNGKTTKKLSEY